MTGERWVAFLRGINVGGANRLPMADLRATARSLGWAGVATYIQSGNLVFEAAGTEHELCSRLTAALADRHGLEVAVVVRSAGDLARIAAAHPDAEGPLDAKLLHVQFLDRPPDVDRVGAVDPDGFGADRWVLDGREVYLTYPGGSGRSKLTVGVFERAWGVTATARNLNTVRTMADLAAD